MAPLTPSELRAKIAETKKPRKTKSKRQPATREDLSYGKILAYDQTLTNTGCAYIEHSEQGLWVQTEMLIQHTDDAGHMGSIDKFKMLHRSLSGSPRASTFIPVIFETPPVQGYRIESSLMAAAAICLVYPNTIPVSNQHAKSVIVANHMATKAQVGAAVNNLVTDHLGPWNEHTRDAVMLGLAYLYDVKARLTDGDY
jgi:Holliday junction resolvasome RuvABC endonuclease subunit